MVALRKDGETRSSRPQRGTSSHVHYITSRDVPLPYVPPSMLVDAVEYRDDGCEFSPSCLACPFARCKYDDPDAFFKLDAARRDREIARLRRDHRAPIALLVQAYGLSRRQIFRILRDQGVTGVRRDAGRGKRDVRSSRRQTGAQ
jgi:hypothetical protein